MSKTLKLVAAQYVASVVVIVDSTQRFTKIYVRLSYNVATGIKPCTLQQAQYSAASRDHHSVLTSDRICISKA